MAFESGTAYPESDADDEYERSVADSSPVLASDSEATESEGLSSNEHTPTTYGAHSSGDRLPETIITEWTAEECADFVTSLGLRQYGDQFLGSLPGLGKTIRVGTDSSRKRDCRRGTGSIAT